MATIQRRLVQLVLLFGVLVALACETITYSTMCVEFIMWTHFDTTYVDGRRHITVVHDSTTMVELPEEECDTTVVVK